MPKKEKEVKEKKQKNSYFKEMKSELKKVVWPTPKELANSTASVIAFVVVITLIVLVLDLCFDSVNKYGITRLQETIKSSIQGESETQANETENQTDTENDVTSEPEGNTIAEFNVTTQSETDENTENNASEETAE